MIEPSQTFSKYIISLSIGILAFSFTLLQIIDKDIVHKNYMSNYLTFFWLSITLGLLFEFLNFIKIFLLKIFINSSEQVKIIEESEEEKNIKEACKVLNSIPIKELTEHNINNGYNLNKDLKERYKDRIEVYKYAVWYFRLSLITYLILFIEYILFILGIFFIIKFIITNI